MNSRGFRYEQLAEDLMSLIESRVLRPGDRLPSVRELADKKRVSMSTALQSLRLMEEGGWIEARPQSGFFVRPRGLQTLQTQASARVPEAARGVDLNHRLVGILQANTQDGVLPLGAALPANELLPIATLHRHYARVARCHPRLLGGNSHVQLNEPALVRQLIKRSLLWGGPLNAEELVITNSCTEALNLCLRTVTKMGDTVAVESPGYYLMLQLIEKMGLKVIEIPCMPGKGMSVEALDLATRETQVAAVVMVPNASNPLGSIMPDEDKRRLAAMMAERKVPVIEDDIYGDLHFDARRPWPIKAFDQTGNVMMCSSFSKSMSPALRLGYVAAGKHHAELRMQKTLSSGATNPITQMVVAEYLESGAYDRHLRSLRRQYAAQAGAMAQAVETYFPEGTRISQPQGGLVLWVELPEPLDTMALYHQAIKSGIAFVPGEMFSPGGLYKNYLRLNCGNPWSSAIEHGVKRLGAMAREMSTA